MHPESKYFNAFNLVGGVGAITFKKLLTQFGSLEKAWLAEADELSQAGLNNFLVQQIKVRRPKIDPDSEMEKLLKENINLIIIKDKNYPVLLREIYNPPALLYVKGKIKPDEKSNLAIVGTRKLSAYGRQITPLITADLVNIGLTIVSGLARGIDTLAHKAALKSGGRTIAVLGSGLDKEHIFPFENKYLAEEISQNGAVISEFPIGSQPLAQHFPQRNRIISGLSLGVLVVEAPERSGAVITANCALEQNREVFAIPGAIFAHNSLGPNNLIKMGAKLVTQTNDILEELNLTSLNKRTNRKIAPDSKEETLILKYLSDQPIHIDKIINQTKMSPSIINSALALMEIKGKVKNLGGNNYVISNLKRLN